MTNTKPGAKNNKARGKADERDVARILGGRRHPADTGGKEDVEHESLAIQVKGGMKVINETVRVGVDSARAAAVGTNKLPVCVVVDRSSTRLRRYAVLLLEDFAAWGGYGAAEDE